MAASPRQPTPIQMPSLQGHSLSRHRHRIKAWKITLLCLYGASITLGQRTLNCNSATVEKKKVNWAQQPAQLDKLLLVVIFQMLLTPSPHSKRDGRRFYRAGRSMTLITSYNLCARKPLVEWNQESRAVRQRSMTSTCYDLNSIIVQGNNTKSAFRSLLFRLMFSDNIRTNA